MKYDAYSAEDFLKDEFFVKWVLNPDIEADHFWKNWIENNPARVEELSRAQHLVRSLEYVAIEKPEKKDYIRVFENVLDFNNQTTSQKQQRYIENTPVFWKSAYKIAAAVALLILAGWFWYGQLIQTDPDSTVAAGEMVTKVSPNGRKTTVKLPDGTIVALNSGSSLTYAKHFGPTDRKVKLTGEAIFDVQKDPSRPFVVNSGAISTTALGTSFNVRAYEDEELVVVSLATGKVLVEGLDKADRVEKFYLEPGQGVSFSKANHTMVKGEFDIEQAFAWNRGVMVFENANMKTVLKELERWYGVSFDVSGSLAQRWNYTGKFEKQSLENVLRNLSFSQKFEYSIKNKTVNIKL